MLKRFALKSTAVGILNTDQSEKKTRKWRVFFPLRKIMKMNVFIENK